MYGVFVNEGYGEKCVFKNENLITVMQKQSEYVKKAKAAERKGKNITLSAVDLQKLRRKHKWKRLK